MKATWAIGKVVIIELVRRKDFYVLFTLAGLITLVAGSVNVFNDRQVARYLVELNYLLVMISSLVIAITTAARQIPAEQETRTLLSLLAKPVTRDQVVAGKFLGAWLACGICLAVFYGFLGVIAWSRDHQLNLWVYMQAAWLHWILLGIVVALSLAGSMVFAAPSSNATICLVVVGGLLVVGRHLDKLALNTAEPLQSLLLVGYYGLPHLEFFDLREILVHHWPPVKMSALALASLYGLFYIALLLTGAALLFRRRRLN